MFYLLFVDVRFKKNANENSFHGDGFDILIIYYFLLLSHHILRYYNIITIIILIIFITINTGKIIL